jgi:hypothetical protein
MGSHPFLKSIVDWRDFMISDGKPFDTNIFFSGGAGMFIQYHDIVKPVYLYAVIKMLLTKTSFGLPLEIINSMSIFSLIEWYIKRRYRNPLRSLDCAKLIDPKELDDLLANILKSDSSIYSVSPSLNVRKMLSIYRRQHMSFPIYVYNQEEDPHIISDCKEVFPGLPVRCIFGNLRDAIAKCDQNFTYILSDIELVKELAKILLGTCSHILLAKEYRYNYIDNCDTFKYNLIELGRTHPFVRIGLTHVLDIGEVALSFRNMTLQGGAME